MSVPCSALIPPPNPPPTIPPVHPIPRIDHIGHLGHIFQWIGFAVFLLTTAGIVLHSKRYAQINRTFHIITASVAIIAALAYYATATGSGYVFIDQGRKCLQGREVVLIRQIYWARYVDWALTTPLIVLALGLLAGTPWLDILLAVGFSEAMFVTALFGALRGHSFAQWGWYAFSILFLVAALYMILYVGHQAARLQHERVAGIYFGLALLTAVTFVGYQVVFILANVFHLFPPTVETIVYTVLDVASRAGFACWLIAAFGDKESDQHPGSLPDHVVEPRSRHRGIRLPGGD